MNLDSVNQQMKLIDNSWLVSFSLIIALYVCVYVHMNVQPCVIGIELVNKTKMWTSQQRERDFLDKYLNIHWNQKTTKISRDIISNSDKSSYAVIHWATLSKWDADQKKRKIKEYFQGQSRNRASQKGGVMRLAERFSEREKEQKEWTAGESRKFKVSCYLSST